MTKNSSKKERLSFSYTYLASMKINTYMNFYKYDSAENEILDELKKIFQKHGNVSNFDIIMSDKNEIRSIYSTKIGSVVDKTDYLLKTELKHYLLKEHLSQLNVSQFWSNFVFGFNAISRKIERGQKFHSILIDNALKDAPILQYVRELANNKGNSELILTMFSNNKLLEAVNTMSKRFGKVLMIGLLSKGEAVDEVDNFKIMLASRVKPFVNDCPVDMKADAVAIPSEPKLQSTIIPSPMETCPYVTDADQVDLLIASHAHCQPPVQQPADEVDYLSTLKRVRLDPPQTTKFIQLPNKNQNKAKKRKINKKNSVKK